MKKSNSVLRSILTVFFLALSVFMAIATFGASVGSSRYVYLPPPSMS